MQNLHKFFIFIFTAFFLSFGSCFLSGCAISGCGNPSSTNTVDSNNDISITNNEEKKVNINYPLGRSLSSPSSRRGIKRTKICEKYSKYF